MNKIIRNISGIYICFCLILSNNGYSQEITVYPKLSEIMVNKIADSIFKIEGGNNTKYPYGIKSINTGGNKEKARKICINTINNNYVRWIQSGKTNDFISFLGARFCPISDKEDKNGLNKNWVGNLKKELNYK